MNVGIRTGDRFETFKDRAQTRYGILWRNNAAGQDALNHWIFKSAKKKYAEAMCMAENERQTRGERCWSDQKSFCVKNNLRKGSKNVGETRDLQNVFSLKHRQEDCAKECEHGARWTLSRYIERSRTVRKYTGNIGMHGSWSERWSADEDVTSSSTLLEEPRILRAAGRRAKTISLQSLRRR